MVQKYKDKRDEGFTIIEVLIVLAIAGLILLIVFLAVPALQRNARNNARNNEASRISAAVTECLSNRNGITTSCDSVGEIAVNPATDLQEFTQVIWGGGNGTETQAVVQFGRVCTADGSGKTGTGATPRDFTVSYQREPALNRCIGSQ